MAMRRARIKGVMNLPVRRPDGKKVKESAKENKPDEDKTKSIAVVSLPTEENKEKDVQVEILPKITEPCETPKVVPEVNLKTVEKSQSNEQKEFDTVVNKLKEGIKPLKTTVEENKEKEENQDPKTPVDQLQNNKNNILNEEPMSISPSVEETQDKEKSKQLEEDSKSKVIKPGPRRQRPKPNIPDNNRRNTTYKNSVTNSSIASLPVNEIQNVPSPEKVKTIKVDEENNKTNILEGNKNRLSPPSSSKIISPLITSPQSNSNTNLEKSALRERSPAASQQNTSIHSTNIPKKTRNSHRSTNIIRSHKEFLNKFKNGTPDRKSLTMFDLIYYNPTNNPLRENQEPSKVKTQFLPMNNEEDIDDPQETQDKISAPQVMIGPDGQIVVDEQSLIIETTGAKKARLDLAKSQAIVDDGSGAANYGMYRRKVSRGWSKQETLKFYKALNTIGTDFLLMQTLFPDRTRREIKMKFKKEDRIHRSLIEKTLRNPLDFDLEELEREAELEKAMQENPEKKEEPKPKRKKLPSNRSGYSQICEEALTKGNKKRKLNTDEKKRKRRKKKKNNNDEDEDDEDQNLYLEYMDDLTLKNIKTNPLSDKLDLLHSKEQEKSNLQENNEQINENQNLDEDLTREELNELEFLSRAPKPTRSGRIPQSRITSEHLDVLRESEKAEKELPVAIKQSNPTDSKVPAGTMLLFSSPSQEDPSSMVYQLFMVGPSPSIPGSTNVIASSDPMQMSRNSAMIAENSSHILIDSQEAIEDSIVESADQLIVLNPSSGSGNEMESDEAATESSITSANSSTIVIDCGAAIDEVSEEAMEEERLSVNEETSSSSYILS